MADETLINGQAPADDFHDTDDQNDESAATVDALNREIRGLEEEKSDLLKENQEMKEKLKKLAIEAERAKGEEEELKEKLKEMVNEVEQAEEDKKVLESIAARALELETEVARLQHDLISAMSDGDDASKELSQLKVVVGQKSAKIDGLEMEIEVLKKEKAELEKRVRELERNLGVLEVKESEERSKRLRVEEEMKDKIDEKNRHVSELMKKVESLESVIANSAKEIEKLKSEEKAMEKRFQESEEKVKTMQLLSQENATVARNVANGDDTEVTKRSVDFAKDGQWMVLAMGATVAVAACVCYVSRRR